MLIDALFIITISIIALITPKRSGYRAVNLVLVGEFVTTLVIVGFSDLYLDQGVYVYLLKLVKDLMFVVIFWRMGGVILSRIQGWMASFHVAVIASIFLSSYILDDYYSYIMGAFCAAQILCGIRGALHGVVCRHHFIYSGGIVHRRRHP